MVKAYSYKIFGSNGAFSLESYATREYIKSRSSYMEIIETSEIEMEISKFDEQGKEIK